MASVLRRAARFSAIFQVFAIGACSSDDDKSAAASPAATQSSDGGSATGCATGPVVYGPTAYPPDRTQSASSAALPECPARCGEQKLTSGGPWNEEYGLSALPTGSCSDSTIHCQISAGSTQTCGSDTHTCDFSAFECFCESGNWRCYSTSRGAGACAPCADAGTN